MVNIHDNVEKRAMFTSLNMNYIRIKDVQGHFFIHNLHYRLLNRKTDYSFQEEFSLDILHTVGINRKIVITSWYSSKGHYVKRRDIIFQGI